MDDEGKNRDRQSALYKALKRDDTRAGYCAAKGVGIVILWVLVIVLSVLFCTEQCRYNNDQYSRAIGIAVFLILIMGAAIILAQIAREGRKRGPDAK